MFNLNIWGRPMKFLFIALMLLPLSACLDKADKQKIQEELTVNQELSIKTSDGVTHDFNIEYVSTLEDMARGLMYRTEMAEDAGMLFDFGTESERKFWMKNTLIPLDMIFIKSDGTIHHIHKNAIPEDLTRISSKGAVKAVLELNGGSAEKLNIQIGDKIEHPIFNDK